MKTEVRAWMQSEIHTLNEDDTLMDAINLTRKHQIRHIPIVRNGQTLVGIVSGGDIKKYMPSILTEKDADEYQRVLEETPLGKIMTREPTTVTPSTPIRQVVEIFCQKKFGALPVIADGKLVGIVTGSDMLRAFHQGLVGAEKKKSR